MVKQTIVDHGYAATLKQIANLNNVFTKVGYPENADPKRPNSKALARARASSSVSGMGDVAAYRAERDARREGVTSAKQIAARGRMARAFATHSMLRDAAAGSTMSEIIEVAAVHEFGAPKKNIPERSHVRTAYDENVLALRKFMGLLFKRMVAGQETAESAIAKVGEWMTWRTKDKIRKGPFVPNSKRTIARKGSSRPLIDTAQMIGSVQHVEVTR